MGSERLEELGVLKQPVNGFKLSGHSQTHLGKECFPQGGSRVRRSQHGGLDP